MPCAWSGAWWVPDVMGGSCNSSGGGLCCTGEGSSSLSTSKHKHCNPLLRKWGSNKYVLRAWLSKTIPVQPQVQY